jgi:hypothetical protein
MKLCPNPDCPSHLQSRQFYDDDTICPRCGEVLEHVAGTVVATTPVYPVVAPASPAQHGAALLGAAGTILLVFVLIGLALQLGLFHRSPGSSGSLVALPPVAGTLTPGALPPLPTVRPAGTAAPTPIGGLIATPGPGFNTSALPTLPPLPGASGSGTNTGGGGSGLTASQPDNGAGTVNSSLCRRLEAGQLCEGVSSYGARDTFYLAVQATFGPGAARSIRVRLYGPPNGETPLLTQDQTNTPARDGRYWVGFAFSQAAPWATGVYRADIFVNQDTARSGFASWTVVP